MLERKNKVIEEDWRHEQKENVQFTGIKRAGQQKGEEMDFKKETDSNKKANSSADKKNDHMIEVVVASLEWPQINKR